MGYFTPNDFHIPAYIKASFIILICCFTAEPLKCNTTVRRNRFTPTDVPERSNLGSEKDLIASTL